MTFCEKRYKKTFCEKCRDKSVNLIITKQDDRELINTIKMRKENAS